MFSEPKPPESKLKKLASNIIGGFVKDFLFIRRALLIFLIIGAFLYMSFIAMLYRDQERLIFHPKKTVAKAISLDGYNVKSFDFEWSDGLAHGFHYKKPKNDRVLIFCYGNADNVLGSMSRMKWFSNLFNCSMIVADYPGYGETDGSPGQASIDEWLEALHQVISSEFNYRDDQKLIWGHSLGGGVAARLASFYGAHALVLESSFTSVTDMASQMYPFIPISLILRHPFPSFETLKANFQQPIFLIHSIDDRIVDFSHSEKMHREAGWPLLIINGGHNTGSTKFRKKIANFLKPHLGSWVLENVENP